MAKTITAQMFAPVPPRHDYQVVQQPLAFQHPDNDHARTGFAVIALLRATIRQQDSPCIMGGLGVGFVPFKVF